MSLSSLGIIVVVFSISIAALVYLADINRYKGKIEKLFKKHTGRAVQVQDRIRLTFLPWAGLNLGKIRIGNAQGFEGTDFADIHGVKVRVKVMPLFAMRVVVDTVRVDGVNVNLTRNADGVTNWDDLLKLAQEIIAAQKMQETQKAQKAQKTQETQEMQETPVIENSKPKKRLPSLPSLSSIKLDHLPINPEKLKILGLDIKGMNLIFDDQVTQAVFKLTDLKMKTSEISLNQPVQVQVNTTVSARNLKAMEGMAFDTEMEVETKVSMLIERSM